MSLGTRGPNGIVVFSMRWYIKSPVRLHTKHIQRSLLRIERIKFVNAFSSVSSSNKFDLNYLCSNQKNDFFLCTISSIRIYWVIIINLRFTARGFACFLRDITLFVLTIINTFFSAFLQWKMQRFCSLVFTLHLKVFYSIQSIHSTQTLSSRQLTLSNTCFNSLPLITEKKQSKNFRANKINLFIAMPEWECKNERTILFTRKFLS